MEGSSSHFSAPRLLCSLLEAARADGVGDEGELRGVQTLAHRTAHENDSFHRCLRRSSLSPLAARLHTTTQALRTRAATATQLWAVLHDGALQARPIELGVSLRPGDGAGSSGTSSRSRSSLWRGSVRSAYLRDDTTSTPWFASSTASTRPNDHLSSPNSLPCRATLREEFGGSRVEGCAIGRVRASTGTIGRRALRPLLLEHRHELLLKLGEGTFGSPQPYPRRFEVAFSLLHGGLPRREHPLLVHDKCCKASG